MVLLADRSLCEINEEEASKNLYRSMLARAIRDLVRYKGAEKKKFKRIYEDAYKWVYEMNVADCTTKDDKLMSFESVCGILGFDHERVRERIPCMTDDDLNDLREIAGR